MADIEAVAQGLLELDEDELIAQLGARAQAIEANPELGAIGDTDVETAVPRGAFNDLFKSGEKLLTPINAQAYAILCSPIGGDGELAQELDRLMTSKTAEGAAKMSAMLAPVLATSLGLPQSLAVIAGSVIVKKIAKGTSDLVCENWKASLAADSLTPPSTDSSTNPATTSSALDPLPEAPAS